LFVNKFLFVESSSENRNILHWSVRVGLFDVRISDSSRPMIAPNKRREGQVPTPQVIPPPNNTLLPKHHFGLLDKLDEVHTGNCNFIHSADCRNPSLAWNIRIWKLPDRIIVPGIDNG